MKYSGRRSYAFLALAALEKGTTVKNEARFWSRGLGCSTESRKRKKTQNISPWSFSQGIPVQAQSAVVLRFFPWHEILNWRGNSRRENVWIIKTQFASLCAGKEKGEMRFFSYSRQDQLIIHAHCSSRKNLLISAKYRIDSSEKETQRIFQSFQRSISSYRPCEIFSNICYTTSYIKNQEN